MSPVSSPSAPGAAEAPRSASSFALNLVALATTLVTMYLLHEVPALAHLENTYRVALVLLAATVPVGVLDLVVLRVHRRESTGLDWDRRFAPSVDRVGAKLLGLALTIGVIAGAYWLFPEYHGAFYDPFYGALRAWWAPLCAIAVVYTTVVDGLQKNPRDSYWQLGRWVLGDGESLKRDEVANHARGWLVKAFFLPLMFTYLSNDVTRLVGFDFTGVTWANTRLYTFLYDFVFLIDVTFCSAGYILALRLWDSHLRSAEPTMLGWAVALFCYMPFFSLFDRQYVQYDGPGFVDWLRDYPALRGAWAAAILLLVVVYVLATVGFGWRFSNLTHRGILTDGPYRFTKHPAYLSKNLSWWLSSVPFVATAGTGLEGKLLCARHCVLLFAINTMYFLRARTEERHLSRDPVYVAYALWMNDHGVLRFLNRWDFFRYKAPTAAPRAEPEPEADKRASAEAAE